jgi:serine/threonine-protein kinase
MPPVQLSAGVSFDRYVIEGLLGEGGMGRVYRAFDPRLHRRVALKILDGSTTGTIGRDKQGVASILREARAAAALDAPNVVSIYDLGDHEGVPFLAMELVHGRPLRALVGRREIPMDRRVGWLVQIARALAAAHRAGVIHRDVKPENIMVREDDVVKVLDFGIAHQILAAAAPLRSGEEAAPDVRALAETLVGTPLYMAPEQVLGQELDGRADQFAWGVVAYELCAGRSPWTRRESVNDVIDAVLHEQPQSLVEQAAEVGDLVSEVVMRALSKDREARFGSMGELLEALGAPEISSASSLPDVEDSYAGPSDVTVTLPGRMSSGPRLTPAPISAPVSSKPPISAPVSSKPPISRPAPSAKNGLASKDAPASQDPAISRGSRATPAVLEAPAANEEAAPAPVPAAAPRRRAGLVVGAIAAVIAAAAAVTVLARPRVTPPVPAPSASASAEPATTTMLELPPPRGCNAAATADFHRGMATLHDGNWEQAAVSFEKASLADPDCADALLRLVMTRLGMQPIAETRTVYQRAMLLRSKLHERDRLLLEAYELLVRREPSDERGFGERVRALAERYPGDAELWGTVASHGDDNEAIIAAGRRALAIDPSYSDALQALGRALWRSGRRDEALATFDQCVRVAPNSVDCLRERLTLLERVGRCADAAESAKLWIARDPDTSEGYLALGSMLSSQGRTEGVEEAFRQRWQRLAEPKRTQMQGIEQASLAALTGDLAAAEKQARAILERAAGTPSFEVHARPTLLLVDVLTEAGRSADAAAIAADFLARRSAWPTSLLQTGTLDMELDLVEPRLLFAARRGGRLSEAEWRAARSRWVSSVRSAGLVEPHVVWALDAAMPAETPAEAEEALRAAPTQQLPASRMQRGGLAHVGRVLLLGGKVGEAVDYLRAAASSCVAINDPVMQTRAHLWLGTALEKQGDTEGACAAYATVLRRLGRATPRSITAEAAKKRADALACKR